MPWRELVFVVERAKLRHSLLCDVRGHCRKGDEGPFFELTRQFRRQRFPGQDAEKEKVRLPTCRRRFAQECRLFFTAAKEEENLRVLCF